jgi:DMSO/TMAO reductase YedYZ molybdopterin-dependent catalytic subunit
MVTYVLAEAADGYSVLCSLAELDSDFQDSEVIVADTMNGSPLREKQGPFKMVAPHDKRPARWIRMLKSLTVVRRATETVTYLNMLLCSLLDLSRWRLAQSPHNTTPRPPRLSAR